MLLNPGRSIVSKIAYHTAELVETEDGPRWVVTWMPGRILTEDEKPSEEWRDHLGVLAAPLGLTAGEALLRASGGPELPVPWPPEGWQEPSGE